MYPLITGLHLHADRGTANNDQPDRRLPGQVVEAMRHTEHGVRQLARALRDHAAGNPVALVDEAGQPEIEGTRVKTARDVELRSLFPQGSRTTRPPGPADTPHKKLEGRVADLSETFGKLVEALAAVDKVRSDRGGKLIEEVGIAPTSVNAWLTHLDEARNELTRWKMIHEFRTPVVLPPAVPNPEPVEADTVTVEELDDLSSEQLAWLAEDLGLDVPGGAGRDELLDALSDRIRDRDDPEAGATPPADLAVSTDVADVPAAAGAS
jgi:hypothetical protein